MGKKIFLGLKECNNSLTRFHKGKVSNNLNNLIKNTLKVIKDGEFKLGKFKSINMFQNQKSYFSGIQFVLIVREPGLCLKKRN